MLEHLLLYFFGAQANAKKDPAWNVFNKNKNVLAIAHKSASVSAMGRQHANMRPEKIVDIIDFRTLLVELFVTSILWSYFITADNYEVIFFLKAVTNWLYEMKCIGNRKEMMLATSN